MSAYQEVPHKRTIWIWLITLYFILSAILSPLSWYLIWSGAIPLDGAQKAYFDHLTLIDYVSMIILYLLNITAAVALFLLRKVARDLFLSILGLNLVLAAWNVTTKGWAEAVGGSGWIGMLVFYVFLIAVCIYAWRLSKKGVLH